MQAATTTALRPPSTQQAAGASRAARIIRGISPQAILAFAIMILSEAPVLFVRALLLEAAIEVASIFTGRAIPLPHGWVAIGSFAWAAIAMILPAGDGWVFRRVRGAREPNEREQAAFTDAVQLIREHAERPLTLPAVWYVTEQTLAQIALYGETLTIASSLLTCGFLPELLAHEIARIEAGQGRLTTATTRLTLRLPGKPDHADHDRQGTRPPRHGIARAIAAILSYARGGHGIEVTEPIWQPIARAIDRRADERAKQLTRRSQAGEMQAA